MLVPFGFGVADTAWCPIVGASAPTLVALWFRGGVGNIFSLFDVIWNVGVVVWGLMALDIVAFVRAVSLLVNPYADPI